LKQCKVLKDKGLDTLGADKLYAKGKITKEELYFLLLIEINQTKKSIN
jgi:hypothetical protein